MNRVHIKARERAAELEGGVPELARRLAIPATTLILMLDGTVSVPAQVFVEVVDLIIHSDLSSVTAPVVLVVEDDPATAYSFSRLVRDLGYRVETATTGAAALEHIRTRLPAVAFVDLRLPDITGWQLAEIVKKEGLSTRVVAMTAYGSSPEERGRSLAAGFEAHFSKPIDRTTVQSLLPKRQKQ